LHLTPSRVGAAAETPPRVVRADETVIAALSNMATAVSSKVRMDKMSMQWEKLNPYQGVVVGGRVRAPSSYSSGRAGRGRGQAPGIVVSGGAGSVTHGSVKNYLDNEVSYMLQCIHRIYKV
jgi:uncharacterized membrane protein YgcG